MNNNNGLFEMVAVDGMVVDWAERISKKQKNIRGLISIEY
jgi:hypothetical protein